MADNYDQGSSKDPFGWLFALFLVTIVLYFLLGYLWSQHSQVVKDFILTSAYYLRWVQIPFSPILSDAYKGALYNLPNLYQNMIGTNYADKYVSPFLQISLRSLGIVAFSIFIPRGIYLIINNDKINFSRSLKLFDLIKIKREFHPRIKPTTSRNLLLEDSRFGSLASQMNPIEFIVQKGMIDLVDPSKIEDEDLREDIENRLENLKIADLRHPATYLKELTAPSFIEYANLKYPTGNANPYSEDMVILMDNIDHYHGVIAVSREKIKDYLIDSLGPRCRYTGKYIDIRLLPKYERALWVIFMACIAQKKELRVRIESMLDQMSDTFSEGVFGSNIHQMDLNGIDELYDLSISSTKVKLVLAQLAKTHGYYYTAFTGLYTAAKKNYGTITSQDFRWLKITNRILFYAINQIGMERARYEASAIRSHYLAELRHRKSRGKKIGKPQVDSAVLNIIGSLDMEEWTALPQTYEDIDPVSPTFMRRLWIQERKKEQKDIQANTKTNSQHQSPTPA